MDMDAELLSVGHHITETKSKYPTRFRKADHFLANKGLWDRRRTKQSPHHVHLTFLSFPFFNKIIFFAHGMHKGPWMRGADGKGVESGP